MVAYTPIKEYIPGYASTKMRKTYVTSIYIKPSPFRMVGVAQLGPIQRLKHRLLSSEIKIQNAWEWNTVSILLLVYVGVTSIANTIQGESQGFTCTRGDNDLLRI